MALHRQFRGRTCAIAGLVGWAWLGLVPAHGADLTSAILLPTGAGEATDVTGTILGAAPFQQFYIGVKDGIGDLQLVGPSPDCIKLVTGTVTNLPGMAPNMDNPAPLANDDLDVLENTGECLPLTPLMVDGMSVSGALLTPTDGGFMAQVELTVGGHTATVDLFADQDGDGITDNYESLYTGSATGMNPLEDLDASLEPGTPTGDLWPAIDEARGVCVSSADPTEGFIVPGLPAPLVCKHIRTDARLNPTTGNPPRDLYLSFRLGETCDGQPGNPDAGQVAGLLPETLATIQTADIRPHLLAAGQMVDRAEGCELAGSTADIIFTGDQVLDDRDMGFNSASPARRPAMRVWEIIESPALFTTPVGQNTVGALQTGLDNVLFFLTRYQNYRDLHVGPPTGPGKAPRLGTYVPGNKAGQVGRTKAQAVIDFPEEIDELAIPWYIVHEILHGLNTRPYGAQGYHCAEDSGCMVDKWLYLKGNDWYIPSAVRSIEIPDQRFQ